MKVCHTEVMKLIKELEEQKSILLSKEDESCTVSFKEGEEKITNGYNYAETRQKINEIDARIRFLRSVLAKANCTVLVDKFNVTIGEALVMLAQLQNQRAHLESLARNKQLSRRITMNGVLEFTECLYSTEQAQSDAKALRQTIAELQMCIDRANLVNFVEI